ATAAAASAPTVAVFALALRVACGFARLDARPCRRGCLRSIACVLACDRVWLGCSRGGDVLGHQAAIVAAFAAVSAAPATPAAAVAIAGLAVAVHSLGLRRFGCSRRLVLFFLDLNLFLFFFLRYGRH